MAKERKPWFSPGQIVDKYFLLDKNAYSKRRPVNMRSIVWTGSVLTVASVLALIRYGDEIERKNAVKTPSYDVGSASNSTPTNQGVAIGGGGSSGGLFGGLGGSLAFGGKGGSGSSRNRSANQVIRRGANGNDPGAQISLGNGIPVKLVNSILSTDATSPVIAEVTGDVYAHGTLSIPAGTRAIGAVRYDDASRRIQLKFQTFVYPEGDQHAVQAIGMMPDGSAGLDGDYHSGEATRQTGRLLGNFIGGLADGMKNRQSAGQLGLAYEPGSITNGLLNGVAQSASDEAKTYGNDLGNTKPFMTLSAGQTFVLFLEREYVP